MSEEQTTETEEATEEIHGSVKSGESAEFEDQGTEQDDQAEADQDSEDDSDATADPVKAARREAGKFRRRLREAEAERDALAEQLEATRWGVVQDKLRGLKSTQPLKNNGHDIAEFLTEDGTIDVARVHQIEAQFVEATGLSLRPPSDSWSQDAGKDRKSVV